MLVCYTGLLVGCLLMNPAVFYVAFACWIFAGISMLVLSRTRKYELVAYAHVVLGVFLPGISMFKGYSEFHFVSVIFMLNAVLMSFITIGRKVGFIAGGIQFVWIFVFLFFNEDVANRIAIEEKIAMLIGFTVAFLFFGYLIVEFLKLRKRAENKYVAINRDLNEINHLVNVQYQEKTVMLKEIHHRVKNNLQVISSLLRLQSYEIEEESSRMHFQDAIYRVSAMALIHEKMYQNENLSQINLQNYIETLAEDLVRTHARDIHVKLQVESDIHELGNDTLVPVALILNELITNSLKHAFVGKNEGHIDIQIKRTEQPDYFNFIYKDSGVWKASPKTSSFGLELIATLTEQLDGKVERGYEDGTKYEFVLKDIK